MISCGAQWPRESTASETEEKEGMRRGTRGIEQRKEVEREGGNGEEKKEEKEEDQEEERVQKEAMKQFSPILFSLFLFLSRRRRGRGQRANTAQPEGMRKG